MSGETSPPLRAIVDRLLGAPYDAYNCWALLRVLFQEGWQLDLEADPAAAVAQVQEVWFQGDDRDPLALVQPWDILIFRTRGMASSHVGIVYDTTYFVHTRRRVGVCLERYIPVWRPRILQIGRLRRLLG